MDSNYVIRLYGADFIHFEKLTVSANGNDYARVFDLYKGSDSLEFHDNVLNSAVVSQNSDDKTIIFSEESLFRSRIIEGNTLQQSRVIARKLAAMGLDYISVSAGGKYEDSQGVLPRYEIPANYPPQSGYSGYRTMPPAWMPEAAKVR